MTEDEAVSLLADPLPERRQHAARVLARLGGQDRLVGDGAVPALAVAARREPDGTTRAALVDALGSTVGPVQSHALLSHAADPHPAVRVAVAASLPLVHGDGPLPDDVVRTLIALSTDEDGVVRDHATMALGSQCDDDTPEIRDALAARLADDAGDTAFEACLGLARRGDVRALGPLQHRLGDGSSPVFRLDLQAAVELADPVLVSLLDRLDHEWSGQDDEHTALLGLARERSAPDAAARAAALEATALGIAAGIADGSGWSITLTGSYPRTRFQWTGPDGAEVESAVWDGLSPARFEPHRQAAHWVHQVPALAASRED